jgi:hypothetical protein
MAYYFACMKNRDLVSWKMKSGLKCYVCQEDLDTVIDDDFFKKWEELEKQGKVDIKLCKSCDRQRSIDILFSEKRNQILLKIRKFTLSKKSHKLQRWIMFSSIFFSLVGLIFVPLHIEHSHFSDISSVLNIVLWGYMVYVMRITTVPKQKVPKI